MRFINRARGTGKTSMLISTAYVMNIPIIVISEATKKYVIETSKKMGCNIAVYTVKEFRENHIEKHVHYDKVLLDESKDIISQALNDYFKCEVVSGTMTIPMETIPMERKSL